MENNFENKIKELEVIVKELESGEVNLDDAIDKLTSFIEENDLKDLGYGDRTFEFHLWF